VISDRYIPSALVMQRFDGIDPMFLWQLNSEADRPDLAVILEEADPGIITEVETGLDQAISNLPVEMRFDRQLDGHGTRVAAAGLPRTRRTARRGAVRPVPRQAGAVGMAPDRPVR
jgi:hypothetical protein